MADPQAAAGWDNLTEFIDAMWTSHLEASTALQEQRHKRVVMCVDCGARSGHGRGWHAELMTHDEHEDEAAIYCPDCWERELG